MGTSVGNQSSLCCFGIGGADNRIDVVVATPTPGDPPGAYYDYSSRNIVVPPAPPGQPELSRSRSAETMTHEATHALQHLNFPFETSNDIVGRGIMEGLADATTATMSEKVTWGGFSWGEPWVYGDGQPPNPVELQRDLRIPQTFSRIYDMVNYPANHDRGVAIGNFMYRIKTGFSSLTRFIEFQVNVSRRLVDNDMDGRDLEDFRQAVIDSIPSGEAQALNKINEVWAEMDDEIIISPNPPSAPSVVDGIPLGCSSGYSLYQLIWSSVANADTYEIWSLRSGILPWYEGEVASSPVYVWTTITADMRVKSCNSNGCSGLSIDGYTVTHTLCP